MILWPMHTQCTHSGGASARDSVKDPDWYLLDSRQNAIIRYETMQTLSVVSSILQHN